MEKKLTTLPEAWEYLGQLFELCEHFELPAYTVMDCGLCNMLDSSPLPTDTLRRLLAAKVQDNVIAAMGSEMRRQASVTESCFLATPGKGYAERALFCYLMASVGPMPLPKKKKKQ